MRCFAFLATVYAAALGTTSALVDASATTVISVSATGYDTSTSGNGGCDPVGCVPEYTLDSDLSANSRWSCEGDGCCITYSFEEPQHIVKLRIAFHLGTSTIQNLDVYENGNYLTNITSGGTTLWYQTFYLYTDETEELTLCFDGDDDEWLSITEIHQFLGVKVYDVTLSPRFP